MYGLVLECDVLASGTHTWHLEKAGVELAIEIITITIGEMEICWNTENGGLAPLEVWNLDPIQQICSEMEMA